MNKAKLKAYAPQARKDFIAAVTARAHQIGLAEKNGSVEIKPAEKSGDFVIIAGQSWPAKISQQRANLITRIEKEGFTQTMEAVAYTWFNRFAALRYMEIHDYLSHGYRALSSREGGLPEILNAAPELAQNGGLPGLNAQRVIDLKLAGDKDGELYRLTLIAQCNALAKVMPFLFERIDNETELLLPDNLLLTDSVIAKLVEAIPEADWNQVEIIGWLYQFYISEEKARIETKLKKGAFILGPEIPAKTQLFTPDWIVQYLVQNSVGRLWMIANPASMLKSDWPYYIEPAEQTPEVQAQLDALIQSRMMEDGGSLNPETITVIDPACGSGHILVEAYEVLKAIYLERGYQLRSIPRLILEKNLFGIDIDDRAGQLAGFALLMKARADDRRLFDELPKLNVLALQESKGLETDELTQVLSGYVMLTRPTIASLIDTFAHAKTFGSLIQIPPDLNAQLLVMDASLQLAVQSGDLLAQEAALKLFPMVQQARTLGMQFDALVANPPHMGGKGMSPALKNHAKLTFPDSKSDLFAMFIERGFNWCKPSGFNSMITMQSWMFLSSFKDMREKLLSNRTINTMAHLGARAFSEIPGEVVQTTAFVMQGQYFSGYKPVFFRLLDGQEEQKNAALLTGKNRFDATIQDDFKKIPGSPVAYWVSSCVQNAFDKIARLEDTVETRKGMVTANNAKYVRAWYEVSICKCALDGHNRESAKQSGLKWFPYNKGGGNRKWFGNKFDVVNWENDGYELQTTLHPTENRVWATNFNIDYIFRPNVNWGAVASSGFSARISFGGELFDAGGSAGFASNTPLEFALGFLNSKVSALFLEALNPTLNFQAGNISDLPLGANLYHGVVTVVQDAIEIAKEDWNSVETSWGFMGSPLCVLGEHRNLKDSWMNWSQSVSQSTLKMKENEEENNRIFINAYGLQDELSPEVPESQITLARADRENDGQRLISYAMGCMMGRYSLDEPGLIFAHAGNVDFDPNRYNIFPADADGIVPITDELWFEDDAANRINEFLQAVWDAETLDLNRTWLAESLGQKGNETPQETVRRYIAGSFYKNHLQTYKKRPIYWLFSSGKQGAFQALVYLHRYNESTLSRMRAEYVVPLTGKIQSRIDMLEKDADAATSNAAKSKLDKDIDKLKKKYVELLSFDEKLRHCADLRIQLDLDDGVKVNYGKFGDLLAEVKAVTGGKDE